MHHARALLESRPFLTRIPADDVIVAGRVPTSVPGSGRYRFVATRDSAGSYAMIYAPIGRPFTVHTAVITGSQVRASWFNPRTGAAIVIGTFPSGADRTFTPAGRRRAAGLGARARRCREGVRDAGAGSVKLSASANSPLAFSLQPLAFSL